MAARRFISRIFARTWALRAPCVRLQVWPRTRLWRSRADPQRIGSGATSASQPTSKPEVRNSTRTRALSVNVRGNTPVDQASGQPCTTLHTPRWWQRQASSDKLPPAAAGELRSRPTVAHKSTNICSSSFGQNSANSWAMVWPSLANAPNYPNSTEVGQLLTNSGPKRAMFLEIGPAMTSVLRNCWTTFGRHLHSFGARWGRQGGTFRGVRRGIVWELWGVVSLSLP